MSVAFALCAGVCCGLMGVMAAKSLKQRHTLIDCWIRALERISAALNQQAMPIDQVIAYGLGEHKGLDGRLNQVIELLSTDPLITCGQAFEKAIGQTSLPGEQEPERNILSRCFTDMGMGPLSQRSQGIDQAIAQLRLLRDQAAKKSETDSRLYKSLGWLGGMALALMLI